jgi:hypothetical protein
MSEVALSSSLVGRGDVSSSEAPGEGKIGASRRLSSFASEALEILHGTVKEILDKP